MEDKKEEGEEGGCQVGAERKQVTVQCPRAEVTCVRGPAGKEERVTAAHRAENKSMCPGLG